MTEAFNSILDIAERTGRPDQTMMAGMEDARPGAESIMQEGLDRFREKREIAASERFLSDRVSQKAEARRKAAEEEFGYTPYFYEHGETREQTEPSKFYSDRNKRVISVRDIEPAHLDIKHNIDVVSQMEPVKQPNRV